MRAHRQTVATIQLTPEEAEPYRACPVYLNFHSGFYVFPVRPFPFLFPLPRGLRVRCAPAS